MTQAPQTPISNRGFDAQFLCMIPYHDALILDGIIASVDSVRIKYTYSKTAYDFESKQRCDVLDKLLFALDSVQLWLAGEVDIDPGRESFFKIGNYQRTVTCKLPDGNSFAILVGRYCCDSSVKQIAPEIVMDFNPNKIPPKVWHRIADILAPMAREITVQRFDLAIDIPMARDQLQLVQRPGSGYQKFVSTDGQAVTEYTGERSHHAGIKLYDKGADLGQPDLICTRCEITVDPRKYRSVSDLWPSILSLAPVELDMDFSELPFGVQAVILHPDLHDLLKASVNRNTWAKYRKSIQSYEKTYFTLTADQIAQIDRYVSQSLAQFVTAGTATI